MSLLNIFELLLSILYFSLFQGASGPIGDRGPQGPIGLQVQFF